MGKYIAAVLLSLYAAPVYAAEVKLNSDQISNLLTGKTIKGLHFGVETRQYFSESGLTLWIKSDDQRPSEARYKIENNQYCSSWTGLWNEEKYGCFDMAHDED